MTRERAVTTAGTCQLRLIDRLPMLAVGGHPSDRSALRVEETLLMEWPGIGRIPLLGEVQALILCVIRKLADGTCQEDSV